MTIHNYPLEVLSAHIVRRMLLNRPDPNDPEQVLQFLKDLLHDLGNKPLDVRSAINETRRYLATSAPVTKPREDFAPESSIRHAMTEGEKDKPITPPKEDLATHIPSRKDAIKDDPPEMKEDVARGDGPKVADTPRSLAKAPEGLDGNFWRGSIHDLKSLARMFQDSRNPEKLLWLMVHEEDDEFSEDTLPKIILHLRDRYIFYAISISKLAGDEAIDAGKNLLSDIQGCGWDFVKRDGKWRLVVHREGDLEEQGPLPAVFLIAHSTIQEGHPLSYLEAVVHDRDGVSGL